MAETNNNRKDLEAWTEVLVCPACHGELRWPAANGEARVVCVACGRKYPVEDGIPVLIRERGTRE